MSAVRFMAFADRSWSFDQDVQEISRFSCMLFLSVRGFFDYAGPINPLAIGVVVVWPSSLPERSRHPDPSVFRSSIARPTVTSVYASSGTSRCRLQDSRPGWSRCLLSCRALSSPTTCRFTPAHSDIPTYRPLTRKKYFPSQNLLRSCEQRQWSNRWRRFMASDAKISASPLE